MPRLQCGDPPLLSGIGDGGRWAYASEGNMPVRGDGAFPLRWLQCVCVDFPQRENSLPYSHLAHALQERTAHSSRHDGFQRCGEEIPCVIRKEMRNRGRRDIPGDGGVGTCIPRESTSTGGSMISTSEDSSRFLGGNSQGIIERFSNPNRRGLS